MRKMLYCDSVGAIGSFGLLLVRIALGLVFFYHGGEKIRHATTWMDDLAIPAIAPAHVAAPAGDAKAGDAKAAEAKPAPQMMKIPPWLQAVAAYAEYIGGPALIVGLFTRIFSLGLTAMMVGAIVLVHMQNPTEPFVAAASSSYERAVVYGACALMFFIIGPGRMSMDAILFGDSSSNKNMPPRTM